jgi:hypothetical protein
VGKEERNGIPCLDMGCKEAPDLKVASQEPMYPPVPWILGTLSLWVKPLGNVTDHPLPSTRVSQRVMHYNLQEAQVITVAIFSFISMWSF